MYPHRYRQFLLGMRCRFGRCPNIQVEAILAELRVAFPIKLFRIKLLRIGMRSLNSSRTKGIANTHGIPIRGRLRFLPTQIANGRSGIRNSSEHGCLTIIHKDTLHLTVIGGDNRIHTFLLNIFTLTGTKHRHNGKHHQKLIHQIHKVSINS